MRRSERKENWNGHNPLGHKKKKKSKVDVYKEINLMNKEKYGAPSKYPIHPQCATHRLRRSEEMQDSQVRIQHWTARRYN